MPQGKGTYGSKVGRPTKNSNKVRYKKKSPMTEERKLNTKILGKYRKSREK